MILMDSGTVRILAIAPYEAMATALQRTAESFPSIRLDAYTGDLQEGLEIVHQLDMEDFDAVISRGGTADLIRPVVNLPVVEIPVSVYDVLRTIKLMEQYEEQCAIVGFPGVTENAYTLCNLLRLSIPIETVHGEEEILSVLQRLRESGIRMILCDVITHRVARGQGFQALLITSGENSIQQALQEAEFQGRSFKQLRLENRMFRSMLIHDARQCVVFSKEKECIFSFPGEASEEMLEAMRRRVGTVLESGEILFHQQTGSMLHSVTGTAFPLQSRDYCLFRDQPVQIPLRPGQPGIRSYDFAECQHLFSGSFFTISGSLGELEHRLTPIADSDQPVLILGEGGTGKVQVARALYLRGRYRNHPFFMIDALQLNDRSWDFLVGHHASPLSSTKTVVCFSHLEQLPEDRQQALLSLIEDTGMSRRLRLLFSCDVKEDISMPDFIQDLSVRLGPLTLHLPTLRSRVDEIPTLATLYLGNLNVELNKQISGFEPGALEMLVRYDWPGNYSQFKHVLQELTVLTSGPYIAASDVAELLAKERELYRRTQRHSDSPEFRGMTLEEITTAAVRQALEDNSGNQTLAARQLGISRTTLWRIVSRAEEGK